MATPEQDLDPESGNKSTSVPFWKLLFDQGYELMLFPRSLGRQLTSIIES